MHLKACCTLLLASVLLAVPSAAQTTTAPATQPLASTQRLEWKTNPLLDLHFLMRSVIDGSASRPELTGILTVIAGVSDIERDLGGPMAWGLLEGALAHTETAEQAAALAERLPQRHNLPSGASIEPRACMLRLAELYAKIEPEFREKIWPRHSAAIAAVQKRLAAELEPRLEECFKDLTDRMKIGYSRAAIPVFLVNTAPFPQGFTHLTRGGAVCIVGVDGLEGSLLYEVILHEAMHALDVGSSRQPTALNDLRRRLIAAGMAPGSPAMRNIVHTLFFVQAGETVRRVVDPNHKHYGDTAGYYAKVPRIIATVRPAWVDYLDAKTSRDDALDAIVKSATAGEGE